MGVGGILLVVGNFVCFYGVKMALGGKNRLKKGGKWEKVIVIFVILVSESALCPSVGIEVLLGFLKFVATNICKFGILA